MIDYQWLPTTSNDWLPSPVCSHSEYWRLRIQNMQANQSNGQTRENQHNASGKNETVWELHGQEADQDVASDDDDSAEAEEQWVVELVPAELFLGEGDKDGF